MEHAALIGTTVFEDNRLTVQCGNLIQYLGADSKATTITDYPTRLEGTEALPGVAKESERTMFEVLVRLVAKMRAGLRGRKTGTSALRWRGRSQLWCDSQDLALHTVMSDGVATVRQTLGRGE